MVWRGFGLGDGEFRLPVLMALAGTFARDRYVSSRKDRGMARSRRVRA